MINPKTDTKQAYMKNRLHFIWKSLNYKLLIDY